MAHSSQSRTIIIFLSSLLISLVLLGAVVVAVFIARPELISSKDTSNPPVTTHGATAEPGANTVVTVYETITTPEPNAPAIRHEPIAEPAYREESSANNSISSDAYEDRSTKFTQWKAGSPETSKEFAENVAHTYIEHYRQTGILNVVLPVYSPVTGQVYNMDCKQYYWRIQCVGGDNARVLIQ